MMTLTALARVLNGTLTGADAHFTGVNTDTRTIAPGDLFVALVGERFDAHEFLAEAKARGAVGALVARAVTADLSAVRIPDTRLALGRLAAHWRAQFNIPLIAVTGSNGKTTVKEMIAAILATRGAVCATRGNLNNDIGAPLTLTRLRATDRFAVIEMGMNHLGEIAYLSELARPTVAVIINAQEAHLAGVGSVMEVARAKGEIFTGLTPDGMAIINADDPHCEYWRRLAEPRRIVTFGFARHADVSADCVSNARGNAMGLRTPGGNIHLQLALLGRHNAMNALAASAAALAAGATLGDIKFGLERARPVAGRLEPRPGFQGARVIDDTYNANPGSVAAGLAVLAENTGERVLVLGDMAELGSAEADMHRRVGEQARAAGIERLYAVGDLAALAARGFGVGGSPHASVEALIETLRPSLHNRMTVLVKGSRRMRMERVVAGIVADTSAPTADDGVH